MTDRGGAHGEFDWAAPDGGDDAGRDGDAAEFETPTPAAGVALPRATTTQTGSSAQASRVPGTPRGPAFDDQADVPTGAIPTANGAPRTSSAPDPHSAPEPHSVPQPRNAPDAPIAESVPFAPTSASRHAAHIADAPTASGAMAVAMKAAAKRDAENVDGPAPRDVARSSTADVDAARRREPDAAVRRRRRIRRRFIWISALVAVVLAAGTATLGYMWNPFAPEPAPMTVATPTDGPGASGTVAAGQLTVGQCYAAYTSAWQDEFALADCTSPHAAELFAIVSATEFAAVDEYPGEAALRAESMRACQAPTSLNTSVAREIDDLRIEAMYAMTQSDWDAGVRSYWCFASRESGEPLDDPLTIT
ncbi:MAG: septum formation family protein [Pseudoclavibacter sp.]